MKKGLIFLAAIVSMLGINTVSADTTTTITTYYNHFEEQIEAYNTYKDNIDYLIDYWEENYSSTCPYYVVVSNLLQNQSKPNFTLVSSSDYYIRSGFGSDGTGSFYFGWDSTEIKAIRYVGESDTYEPIEYSSSYDIGHINKSESSSWGYNYISPILSNGVIYYSDKDYIIPTYVSNSLGITVSEIQLKKGLNFPTLINLYDGTYDYNIDEIPALELDDVFSNPLDTLKDLKDAIYNIFSIISEFILMLPPILQGTLITSFTIAIVIGIIKILL